MKRRTFLQNTAAATAATVLAPYILKGQSNFNTIANEDVIADDNITIIIEMLGGNDGLNTIIPVYNDTYYRLRPVLAYPKNETKRLGTSDLYFNKSLVDDVHNGGMMQLMENGNLAIVEGVGYKDPNLSHFRSEDIHLSGINNSDPKVSLLEGWLARYFHLKLPNFPVEVPEHPLAVQIGESLTLLLKARKGHMGVALSNPDKFYELGDGLTPVEPLLNDGTAYGNEFDFVHVIAKQSEMYSKVIKEAYDIGKDKLKVNYSDTGLSQQLKMISALIAGGLKSKVYFVKLNQFFDSHAQQMNEDFTGQHPTLLKEVADGISEFMGDSFQQGFSDRIAGFTISEFGRRTYDNGSRGTDHGAASMQFIFGGKYVEGGYFGNPPDLDNLDEDGNVVYQHEFRRTFVDFLTNWLGANDQDIVDVFGEPFLPIGVLKPRFTTGVKDILAQNNNMQLNVYPNPSAGNSTVKFELLESANVDISIYDIPGYLINNLNKGFLLAGVHKIRFNIHKAGSYILLLNVNGRKYSTKFSILL